MIEPFRVMSGLVAPLPRADVDTDQIIPKQFLKRVGRTGFGECLFYDWRSDPGFVLNQERYRGASILVSGANFGCGSSREHAAWALEGAGFRAVLAPSFADIFAANATRNGLATITLPDQIIVQITRRTEERERYQLTIDMEQCSVRDDDDLDVTFTIESSRRERLLHGLDEIALTLKHEAAITRYETRAT